MKFFVFSFVLAMSALTSPVIADSDMAEQHRPQLHFSPPGKWMNDPNGMVYANGTYHLFYQYYPEDTVWGPMHWGHASSTDMLRWEHKPVALYPDKLGYIFSGSAVVDHANTSGFGKNGKAPLVAIFTHHDAQAAKRNRIDFENQSLAYSLDDGKTWVKYDGNPVLKNPGIRDFRDPKVFWHGPLKRWVMALASSDRIAFYSSPNLKDWKKESEFGEKLGAHGGVWECPDLFPLTLNGKTYWVLLVSINPGGPNGGSATQYFIGDFDGTTFKPRGTQTRWIDHGTDNYAGVTWSDTGERKIFMGWMSNWDYGKVVPTKAWRSAMTIPRDLSLKAVGDDIFLTSQPVREWSRLAGRTVVLENLDIKGKVDLSVRNPTGSSKLQITLSGEQLAPFALTLSNKRGEKLVLGYDGGQYFIDRSASGKVSFEKSFAKRMLAPRRATTAAFDLVLVVDVASVELFADDGLTAMTAIYFPNEDFTQVAMEARNGLRLEKLSVTELKGIW